MTSFGGHDVLVDGWQHTLELFLCLCFLDDAKLNYCWRWRVSVEVLLCALRVLPLKQRIARHYSARVSNPQCEYLSLGACTPCRGPRIHFGFPSSVIHLHVCMRYDGLDKPWCELA